MDPKFLEERLDRILRLVSEEYRVSEEPKKSPKGLTIVIERAAPKKTPTGSVEKPPTGATGTEKPAKPTPTIESKKP
jgi:hypothetical protein